MKQLPDNFELRAMTGDDLETVLQVDAACYDFPWSHRVFSDCLRAGYLCSVLVQSGQPVGHSVLMLGPGEAHILNICVLPALQGSGLGRFMLEALLDSARQNDALEIFLEVRESNRTATRLYESHGFNRIALRENYYNSASGREDAILYVLTLLPGPA